MDIGDITTSYTFLDQFESRRRNNISVLFNDPNVDERIVSLRIVAL